MCCLKDGIRQRYPSRLRRARIPYIGWCRSRERFPFMPSGLVMPQRLAPWNPQMPRLRLLLAMIWTDIGCQNSVVALSLWTGAKSWSDSSRRKCAFLHLIVPFLVSERGFLPPKSTFFSSFWKKMLNCLVGKKTCRTFVPAFRRKSRGTPS